MNSGQKDFGKAKTLIYSGFAALGGITCGIYGFTANRYNSNEILLLMAGGVAAGIALALICIGVITMLKKSE